MCRVTLAQPDDAAVAVVGPVGSDCIFFFTNPVRDIKRLRVIDAEIGAARGGRIGPAAHRAN
jgi:hypothetical protein